MFVKMKMKMKKSLLVVAISIIATVFLGQYVLAASFFGIGGKELKTETVTQDSVKQIITASRYE